MRRRPSVYRVLLPLVLCLGADALRADELPPTDPRAGVRVLAGPDSVLYYAPNRWGTLKLSLTNSRDDAVELLCSTYFEGDDTLQYGRKVWLPPRSRFETSHLLRAPKDRAPDQQFWELRTLVLDPRQTQETLGQQAEGELQSRTSLRVTGRAPVTVLLGRNEPGSAGKAISSYELVLTARYQQDLAENFVYQLGEVCPSTEEAYDAVDQIVIADDRLLHDPAGLTAVRRWLHGGGRLWVMLDRVSPRLCEALLGDESSCRVVDRLGLTEVAFESRQHGGRSTPSVDYEDPVEFVRVVADGMDVAWSVNGWPAVLWQNFGQGQLVLTTISGDALVRPRTAADIPRHRDGSRQTAYMAETVLSELSTQFFVTKSKFPISQASSAAHVNEQVGYAIPSRSLIVGWLTGFLATLCGMGLWLTRRGRLEWFAIGAVAAAVVVGGALVGAGHATRQAVPPTTAVLQFVRPIVGTNDVQISGTVGVFSPHSGVAQISGTDGGWVMPDADGTSGAARRLVWTDFGRWQWELLPQSPGLHTAAFQEAITTSVSSRATASLDERGVVGRWSLPEGLRPGDGAIVTPTGRIGIEFFPDGRFTAAAEQVLARDQFFLARVLTDEQHRRTRLLSEQFSVRDNFVTRPMLVFWTERWDSGLRFQEPSRQTGSALVALPIVLARPPVGSEFVLPAPLLPYRETFGPDQPTPVGFYDYRIGKWLERYQPMSTWLQFHVPASLLPLKPLSARMVLQVSGPVGKLSVAGQHGDRVAPIHTWLDPVGTLSWTIDQPELLSLSPNGDFKLRIAAGDPDRPELTAHQSADISHVSFWQIESLTLELRARATE